MICNHLKNNQCSLVTKLINKEVNIPIDACHKCCKESKPQQENKVVYGIAYYHAEEKDKQKILDLLVPGTKTKLDGPGTELKKLISWFYSPIKKKCKCKTRIQKMNQWGPDECEKRIETITRWLKHSARINKTIYNETIVKILIRKAIRNARKRK
jgi:guanylate kinase